MTISRVLIGLALALWIAAGARTLVTLTTAVAPARPLVLEVAGEPRVLRVERCMGTRVAIGAQIWRRCAFDSGRGTAFERVDLARGVVEARWPTDGALGEGDLQAFAPLPDGGAVAALPQPPRGGPGPRAGIFVLGASGGVTARGELPGEVIALAVRAEHIEAVVIETPGQARIHRSPRAGGDWQVADRPPLPAAEGAPDGSHRGGEIQAATLGADGWTLWGLRPAGAEPAGEVVGGAGDEVDSEARGEAGGERMRQAPGADWTVEEAVAAAWSVPEGLRTAMPRLIHDRSAGGGIDGPPRSSDDAWHTRRLYFDGTTWLPVPRPPAPNDPQARWNPMHHDIVQVQGTALPHTTWLQFAPDHHTYPDLAWTTVGARPFALSRDETPRLGRGGLKAMAGLSLALLQSPGAPLATDARLAINPLLAPDGAEGWWLLGDADAFVRVDGAMQRADPTGALDRFGSLFQRLQYRLTCHGQDMPGTPLTRLGALGVVLLGLPVLLLATLWRRRWWPAAAVAWLLLAALCAPWFWRFTAPGWL